MHDIEWFRWESCTVSSPTLQVFKFSYNDEGEADRDRCPLSVSFDTPNLLYLDYSDDVGRKYPLLQFGLLHGSKIRLQTIDEEEAANEDEEEDEEAADASAFFLGLTQVRKLYLVADTIEVLTFQCQQIPLFQQLMTLDVECHRSLGYLLNNSPQLQALVLHGLFHDNADTCGQLCPCGAADLSCLSTSPVKMVKIFEHDNEADADEASFSTTSSIS
ncbi:PREDICTED: F-box protein At1g56610-like [Camelina sativa]|uniref:F-box protein At1g56610-like n=1 Tax=Camelina sativa TaxID=90675 RepID=A0ABM0ZIF1_CAMSA|nr:PREDICTED: F-box protein At1g56610-like [Camelina sativa]